MNLQNHQMPNKNSRVSGSLVSLAYNTKNINKRNGGENNSLKKVQLSKSMSQFATIQDEFAIEGEEVTSMNGHHSIGNYSKGLTGSGKAEKVKNVNYGIRKH